MCQILGNVVQIHNLLSQTEIFNITGGWLLSSHIFCLNELQKYCLLYFIFILSKFMENVLPVSICSTLSSFIHIGHIFIAKCTTFINSK